MALLTWSEASAITYVTEDIGVLLSPLEQSIAIQAINRYLEGWTWSDYATYSDDIDTLVSGLLDKLELPMPDTFGNTSLFFTPENDVVLAGNGNGFTALSTCMHGGFWSASPTSAINDERATPYFYLKSGAWQISVMFRSGGLGAIITLYTQHDNDTPVEITQIDTYQSVATPNLRDFANFTLPSDGMYRFRLKAATKNPASTGYNMPIQSYLVRRTGD